jgi:hypothetical protein
MMDIRGFNLLLYHPEPGEAEAIIRRGKEYGANAVSMVFTHYVYLAGGTPNVAYPPKDWCTREIVHAEIGQDMLHAYQNTMSPDRAEYLVRYACDQGLRVMLKPHTDTNFGESRDQIIVTKAMAYKFRSSYKRMLDRYIKIGNTMASEGYMAPILCLGTELKKITEVLGPGFWIDIAKYCRLHYRGKLTYAANWGIENDAEYNRLKLFWPYVDYVGVDAYFPLPRATADAWNERLLPQDWAPAPGPDMVACADLFQKPLLLTEIGIGNWNGALARPYAAPPANAVRNDQLQYDYYKAFLEYFDDKAAGFFCWHMKIGPEEVGNSIVGRSAETIVFR